jgi:hypothetical protein
LLGYGKRKENRTTKGRDGKEYGGFEGTVKEYERRRRRGMTTRRDGSAIKTKDGKIRLLLVFLTGHVPAVI